MALLVVAVVAAVAVAVAAVALTSNRTVRALLCLLMSSLAAAGMQLRRRERACLGDARLLLRTSRRGARRRPVPKRARHVV